MNQIKSINCELIKEYYKILYLRFHMKWVLHFQWIVVAEPRGILLD